MSLEKPLLISRTRLAVMGTRLFLYHGDRIPAQGAVLVVSNHRSFQDAPLLMAALNRTIHFATHHYMGQMPVMRQIIEQLAGFPLGARGGRQHQFFAAATQLLQAHKIVGIFPEGTLPMVRAPHPRGVGPFERGFAHLALRAPVADLAVLPVAIAAEQETCHNTIPLEWLSPFDPSEPLFQHSGWHPMVVYQRVNVLIGDPVWIRAADRITYRGRGAKTAVRKLTHYCQTSIHQLLHSNHQAPRRAPAAPLIPDQIPVRVEL